MNRSRLSQSNVRPPCQTIGPKSYIVRCSRIVVFDRDRPQSNFAVASQASKNHKVPGMHMSTEVSKMRNVFRKKLLGPVTLVCVACYLTPLAYAEVANDIEPCNGCHGEYGVSLESDIPSIAGVSPFILEEYMSQYRDEARPCRESKYRLGDTERPATHLMLIQYRHSYITPQVCSSYIIKAGLTIA